MKDYDHVTVWLDYFNRHFRRSKGRRLAIAQCVFDPSLKELMDAAQEAGFSIKGHDDQARFPRRPFVRSGYIVIPKESSKTRILSRIAQSMVARRAKKSKNRQ